MTSEVWTITITGAPVGSRLRLAHTGYQVREATAPNPVARHSGIDDVRTMCDEVFGSGNTKVTGAPGRSFKIAFCGSAANCRIGGHVAVGADFTGGTGPEVQIERTVRGSRS